MLTSRMYAAKNISFKSGKLPLKWESIKRLEE